MTTDLPLKRNGEDSLILDGKEHLVSDVFINEQPLLKEDEKISSNELILLKIPLDENFQVKIKSVIYPFSNDSLEGMYACGQWLKTQCEFERARRIFFTLDRPDVLSVSRQRLLQMRNVILIVSQMGILFVNKKKIDVRRSHGMIFFPSLVIFLPVY